MQIRFDFCRQAMSRVGSNYGGPVLPEICAKKGSAAWLMPSVLSIQNSVKAEAVLQRRLAKGSRHLRPRLALDALRYVNTPFRLLRRIRRLFQPSEVGHLQQVCHARRRGHPNQSSRFSPRCGLGCHLHGTADRNTVALPVLPCTAGRLAVCLAVGRVLSRPLL
jgi:hypothetical protein